MATFTKLSSGSWRVQVRRKGRYISETYQLREDARKWATDAERQVDRGESPLASRVAKMKTFADMIDLHIADLKEVGKTRLAARARSPSACTSARSKRCSRTWPPSMA